MRLGADQGVQERSGRRIRHALGQDNHGLGLLWKPVLQQALVNGFAVRDDNEPAEQSGLQTPSLNLLQTASRAPPNEALLPGSALEEVGADGSAVSWDSLHADRAVHSGAISALLDSCPYTVPLEMQHRKQSFYMHAVYCGKAHRQSASGRCRAVLRLRASHIPAGAGDPKRFLVHSSKHATHVPDSSDHMLRVLERGPGLQSAPVST